MFKPFTKPMTIEELFEECKSQIEKGNGKKNVYISPNEENDCLRPIYFSFTDSKEDLDLYNETSIIDYYKNDTTNNIVILG